MREELMVFWTTHWKHRATGYGAGRIQEELGWGKKKKNQEFNFGYVKLEMPVRNPSEGTE